ncbi:MAG: hypothetical protein WA981_11180 [Glaciecola sp.]
MEWLFSSIFGVFFGLIGFIVWIIPFIVIGTSSKTRGGEKLAWLILMLFFWFAWVFYLFLAPLQDGKRNHRDKYDLS